MLCACAPCLKTRMQEAKSVLKHYLKVRIEFSIHIILVTDIKHYMIQTSMLMPCVRTRSEGYRAGK